MVQPSTRPASPLRLTPVTIKRLSRSNGLRLIRGEGFREFACGPRDLARIEIAMAEMEKFFDKCLIGRIQEGFKSIGFKHTTLDLEGFRSGSLNANVQFRTFTSDHRKVELENV